MDWGPFTSHCKPPTHWFQRRQFCDISWVQCSDLGVIKIEISTTDWLMGRESSQLSHASSFLSIFSLSPVIDWCLTAGKILPPPKKEKFTRGIWTHFIDYYTVLQNSSICRCERGFARFNVLSLWLGRRAQGTVQCGDWSCLWIRARKALSHTLSVQLVRRYEGITGSRFVSARPDLIQISLKCSLFSPSSLAPPGLQTRTGCPADWLFSVQ